MKTTILSNRANRVLRVIDVRGRDDNGLYWRFIGTPGEQIEYTRASADEAAKFDGMLDGVCYMSWDKILGK